MDFTLFHKARSMAGAAALCGLALAASAMPAHAQGGAYPAKPVTVVVAFPPGGMTDIVSRALAKELQERLKQPFVVENRPGGAGQVGTEYVARQAADGYTLLVGATGYVIAPAMKKVGYDPLKSLEPVAVLAKAPNLIVVNPGVPARNAQEFLAWAKKQPNIPFGTAGAAGSTHLGGEWLRKVTGYQFTHVPYKGAAPATNDAVAGQIPMAVQDSMSVSAFITSGRLRPIANLAGLLRPRRHAGAGARAAQRRDQQDHELARDDRAPAPAVQRAAGREGPGADAQLRRGRGRQVEARRARNRRQRGGVNA